MYVKLILLLMFLFPNYLFTFLPVFILWFIISQIYNFINFYCFVICFSMLLYDYWVCSLLKFIWEYLIQKFLKDYLVSLIILTSLGLIILSVFWLLCFCSSFQKQLSEFLYKSRYVSKQICLLMTFVTRVLCRWSK